MSIIPGAIGFFTFFSFLDNGYNSKSKIIEFEKQIEKGNQNLRQLDAKLQIVNNMLNKGQMGAEEYLYCQYCMGVNIDLGPSVVMYREYDQQYHQIKDVYSNL